MMSYHVRGITMEGLTVRALGDASERLGVSAVALLDALLSATEKFDGAEAEG